ncbi:MULTISPECIES: amidohydrolase [Dictyoglomus]|jgi:5-methylthioadenosine/S-adenosylhomocysteine deaminase|uniref:5-methylthioadenosine/S-adenosylhomocysteine deaminase n=1 Tax=Dictyoglomus turgidum (strain DSM 6724 / Z-1310) TaxID=515635 RepID=MTAD_DICTD|nr:MULTISPECIES: amidohydrolase [Dictyoglomus]B8E183.1 RecName: Full=5-methylthioadenosine/S-adenosylhomocysteine deaminase; Short=MTA/SAH deaminase [Dictyoglomus turgidum DSM 6724]ACK42211.1 amidohydrolase [Dictyoglomus turgidum DSM 6724]PNV79856.1 MAG: 5-methylthioadenosine/S-adenosylhomocysteine deaminase [Dictyoglomus turgidum]HBU32441.1 5-methylthioadenosine/S-adenosylhomocysteine deaminase [Dictyoglomus sp.]
MRILIENVSVFQEGDILNNKNILIENDIIKEISEDKNFEKIDYVIEGKNKIALPGLVNTHTHLAMTLFRGFADDLPLKEWLEEKIWPQEAKLTAEDVYWGSLLGICEMIKGGTIAFADMYFFMDEVAKAVSESGVKASLSVGMIGVSGNENEILNRGVNFAQNWHNAENGRIKVMLAPHAPYTCPPSFLEKVINKAVEMNLSIHTHLSETYLEVENIKNIYGLTPVRLMDRIGLFNVPVLAAHCVFVDDEEIEILSEKGVGVAHNPQSNLKLASGVAPVKKMVEKRVKIGLGTDGPASNNNLDLWEEIRLVATLHKGVEKDPVCIPAKEALNMATKNGMEILGFENSGIIKEGYKADLILVNINKPHFYPRHNLISHLVYSALSSDVDTVIVDGKVLMEKRELKILDEEKIMFEAEKRAFDLIKKR